MHTTNCTVTTPNTTFLYPQSRVFPFDEVCEKIVRALEKRSWKAPGIQVEFTDSKIGKRNYRHVSKINGEDFRLWFSRAQGRIGPYTNDIGAIKAIVIPKQELSVFEDESGPTYYTYVGDDWEKDKDMFMTGMKVNSKLRGMPKTYLRYSGCSSHLEKDGYAARDSFHGIRNPYLVNDSDMGREYKACDEEAKYFRTDEVFQEVNKWLEVNVLERIEALGESADAELSVEPEIPLSS